MTILSVATPYQKIKVVEYSARDFNKSVTKYRELQQVKECLYKTHEITDNYQNTMCSLYVVFDSAIDGTIIGMKIANDIIVRDYMNADYCWQQYVAAYHLESIQDFIADLDTRVETASHIGNAQIKFAGYFAPDRVEAYVVARQNYRKQYDEKLHAEKVMREAKDKTFCDEQNKIADSIVADATELIRIGKGTLKNSVITIYRTRYDFSSYCLVNHLARLYDVNVPLKVQGWINNSLSNVKIENAQVSGWTHKRGSRSNTFGRYMQEIIDGIRSS